MGFIVFIVNYITKFIEKTGYIAVFIGMLMESMFFPIPSEAIMPFAGFLIAEKKFNFFLVIFFSTLGSLFGSLISYFLGFYGGKPFINKFGRYLLIDQDELNTTEKFFHKRGQATIFISRFIPVIRHFISIPAGMAKMDLWKFSLFTVLGAGIWNTFLTIVGYYLRQNWQIIIKYSKIIDDLVIIIILILIAFYIYRYICKKNKLKKSKD